MNACDNCGHETETLSPCPCGLGDECPIVNGVCDRCRRLIARNASDRRTQTRAQPKEALCR